jgi:hypothetical protein
MNNPIRQYFYATSPADSNKEKVEHENDWRTAWMFGSNINHHFTTAGGGERAFKEVACGE